MKKMLLLCLFLACCFSIETEAQNYLGLHFNNMQPLEEYNNNLGAQPRGISLSYMFKPTIFKKLYIGAQLGVSMYATDDYLLDVINEENEIIEIEVMEEDCFLAYALTGRYFIIEDKLINPYLEARIGGLSFLVLK